MKPFERVSRRPCTMPFFVSFSYYILLRNQPSLFGLMYLNCGQVVLCHVVKIEIDCQYWALRQAVGWLVGWF